jgi:hypothetical protein
MVTKRVNYTSPFKAKVTAIARYFWYVLKLYRWHDNGIGDNWGDITENESELSFF